MVDCIPDKAPGANVSADIPVIAASPKVSPTFVLDAAGGAGVAMVPLICPVCGLIANEYWLPDADVKL